MSFYDAGHGVWGTSLPSSGAGSFLGGTSFLSNWSVPSLDAPPLSASAGTVGSAPSGSVLAAAAAAGASAAPSAPGAAAPHAGSTEAGSDDASEGQGGRGDGDDDDSLGLDLEDLLGVDLLDEVAWAGDRRGAAAGAAAGATPDAAAPAAPPARDQRAAAAQSQQLQQPRRQRRQHDPDATEFLFSLLTAVHEDAYEAARGDAGAPYRRQIAAEAVEAIERLGADVRGCDAETEDGAPLTLLTLLFRNNDWGGLRYKVLSAAVAAGADVNAYGTIAVEAPSTPPHQAQQPQRSGGWRRGQQYYQQQQQHQQPPPPARRARVLVSPLHLAALQLDVASTAALLAAGADPNAQARVWRGRDKPGGGRGVGTPLHFVASSAPGDSAAAAAAARGGGKRGPAAPPAGATGQQQQPPIVQWRTAVIVELLLRHGADLGALTARGDPPIEVACGTAAALPWGRRRCPAAVYVLRAAARGGVAAARQVRLKMARRALERAEAERAAAAAERQQRQQQEEERTKGRAPRAIAAGGAAGPSAAATAVAGQAPSAAA